MFSPTGFTAFISYAVLLCVHPSYGSEIIGGKEVMPHSMPFMALSTEPVCGGILIQPSWVLTAAHCKEIKEVLLGVHSIKKKGEKKSRQVRKVKLFPHPSYDRNSKIHDLMLLKLNKPAVQTKTVKWLKLGNTVQDPQGSSVCVVAGWGKTTNTGKMSDVLMSVNVTVIDRKQCNARKYYNQKITDSMVCAGSDGKNNADTCKGDSGGPLLCRGDLVGVTSFGEKECDSRKGPGVYTLLSAEHLKWIQQTMKS